MLAVVPGECAAAQLRAADLAGEVLPWQDLLHEGPVPAGLARAELTGVRAGFIGSLGWADTERAHAELAQRDAVLAEAAAEPAEIVLWFDHNVVNRLALLQVLDRVRELRGPSLPDVTLAQPRGFGGASAGELAALHASRGPVTPAQLAHADGAWAAFRSADPTALLPYSSSGPLPGLGSALRRHLEQFPHPRDGLARTERRALAAVAGGAREFAAIYRAVVADDDPPWLGGSVLRAHLQRLADAQRPLLHRDAGDGFEISADGRAVLAGRADHVTLNGIDRWLGGVHLTGPNPWRYHPESGRLSR